MSAEKYDYMLDDLAEEHARFRENQKEIFTRLNELEKRMAQVVVLAIMMSIVAPVFIEAVLR